MMTFYLKKSIPIRTEACIFFLKELLNVVTSFTFKDSYYIASFTHTDIYIMYIFYIYLYYIYIFLRKSDVSISRV